MAHADFDATFATARLVLRPWRRADLDAMAGWPPFPAPLDQVWNWPRRFQRDGLLDLLFASHAADPARAAWTITEHGAVIGLLQLKAIDRVSGTAGLGIALGHPWIGRGYGHEALTALLRLYFERWGFAAMRLEVALANTRALRLYQALGFEERGRFWQAAEGLHDQRLLETTEYAHLRPYLRFGRGGLYQQCAEMELNGLIADS